MTRLKKVKLKSDNSFVCADAMHLPLREESFDCVIFMEVIEHLTHPFRALSEIRRVLVKGGRLVLTTPNMRIIRGIYVHKDHIHEFRLSELEKILYINNFSILKHTGSTIPFIPYMWKKLYSINSNNFFFILWKKMNVLLNIKWDLIVLAKKIQ